MIPIRTLIVDDEPLARQRIASLLGKERDIALIGECGDGHTAARVIRSNSLDLVFLDIQLPEMDGFEILESLSANHQPAIIFVTAYDQYALRAFQVHAWDYLLKPVESERMAEALGHVRRRLQSDDEGQLRTRLTALLQDVNRLRQRSNRVVLTSGKELLCLKASEIAWVESAGNYACVHTCSATHVVKETMSALEQQLSEQNFVRIHRFRLVNFDHVKRVKPLLYGDYTVELRDGTKLTMSRSYRNRALEKLGID